MKKILLIRIDALGDLILTLPAIKAVREFYKDAEIDMVVNRNFVPFMEQSGLVNNVIVWNQKKLHPFFQLRKKKYDLAFDLTPASTFYSSLLLLFAHAKEKGGYAVGIRKYFLTKPVIPKGMMYERDMVLEICKQMSIPVKEKKLFFPINEKKKKEAKEKIMNLLRDYSQKRKRKKIVAIHPSASKKEKIWPKEKFIEVINKFITKSQDITFVFIGTKEEKQLCEDINKQLKAKQIKLSATQIV